MRANRHPVQHDCEIVLHVIRSPVGINWSSPRTLLFSAAYNIALTRLWRPGHAIGHVHIEIKSASRGKRILTGITNADQGQYHEILVKEKAAFGILFHRFPARLEESDEIEESLKLAHRQRRLQSMRFSISPEAFDRCEIYYRETVAIKESLQYGFPCEPRRKEGAGCTAYAMSFLQIAGVPLERFQEWRQTFLVPRCLMGGDKKISLSDAIFSPHSGSWSRDHDSRTLIFWDPDRMFQWMKMNAASGLMVEAHQEPVPNEPIWEV